MDQSFAGIIMNPVRQRIVQHLLLHGAATVNDIAADLSDVPRSSLYRHMRILQEAGCIVVTEERAVRGAVQKVYALVAQPMGDAPSQQEVLQLIQGIFASVMCSFTAYFAREDADPQRDLLSVSSSTLMLSDAELMELFGRIGAICNDYIQNGPAQGRKPRTIVFVSAPADNERGDETPCCTSKT